MYYFQLSLDLLPTWHLSDEYATEAWDPHSKQSILFTRLKLMIQTGDSQGGSYQIITVQTPQQPAKPSKAQYLIWTDVNNTAPPAPEDEVPLVNLYNFPPAN